MSTSADSPVPLRPAASAAPVLARPETPGPAVEDVHERFAIHEPTFLWSVRLFSVMKKVVKVNLKLHQDSDQIDDGDIFLFNHFARFETFIPQYFVHQEVGAYCRSVASAEFFAGDDAFSTYLRRVGAVPNDLHGLLPFLAREVLHGRKIIVFPEGGMVKDRRVIGPGGTYSVYSRTARQRRKHHTGAAVLALALDLFKAGVRAAVDAGDMRRVEAWAESVGLEPRALIVAARRPTAIVPANITFYPIRVSDNLLRKGAELLNRGLSRRMSEELLIEGNILLRDTDMDIRLGKPVSPARHWRWWEQRLVARVARRAAGLEDLFDLSPRKGRWDARIVAAGMRRHAQRIRDDYMHRMYTGVTLNLSHLASSLILDLLDSGRTEIERGRFARMLYVAVKAAQRDSDLNLHRSLRNPRTYRGLLDAACPGLDQFMDSAARLRLVELVEDGYRFLPKLREQHGFDTVRLENPIEVYANEMAPLADARLAVIQGRERGGALSATGRADLMRDDERIAHLWDRAAFTRPRHAEINAQERQTGDSAPFMLLPEGASDAVQSELAVVLVHGFLASPAELRGLGERLVARGYPVYGVRLTGHGTSPWDLRERSWQDWLESVRRGVTIAAGYARRVCIVGFSTGGALALRLAAEGSAELAGIVSVSVPMRFGNRNMRFVPFVHRANRVLGWMSSSEGIMPFRRNDSENPHINYAHMPVRGLYELRLLVDELNRTLGDVTGPVVLIQGTGDPVVDPVSAGMLADRLDRAEVELTMIPSDEHGIVHNDVGGTQDRIIEVIDRLRDTGRAPRAQPTAG